MNDIKKIKDVWIKLLFILTKKEKKLGVIIFFMSIIGALLETVGISAIIPLISVLMDSEAFFSNKSVSHILNLLHISNDSISVLSICIGIAFLFVIKNAYLVLLLWIRTRYSADVKTNLSWNVLHSYLNNPYIEIANKDKNDFIRDVLFDAQGIDVLLRNLFSVCAEMLTCFAICILLFFSNKELTIIIIILGILNILIAQVILRKASKNQGLKSRIANSKMTKYLYESYEGLKEIFVMNGQNFWLSHFRTEMNEYNQTQVALTVISEAPKNIIEAVFVGGILLAVGYSSSQGKLTTSYISTLAAFVVAAVRLMPSMGRITSSSSMIISSCPMLQSMYSVIKKANISDSDIQDKNVAVDDIRFDNKVSVSGVSWKYPGQNREVLSNVNLDIKKGSCIGIIGESGAGKSTLMDIILGLLSPQSGSVKVDDIDIETNKRKWSQIVGYVPQSIYLTDDTIAENVAFGLEKEKIDNDKVWDSLEKAKIKDYVTNLPDKLDTIVGDRGTRFSGGQRQRIAIARALYRNPDIIIFDEATSALDNETERVMMDSIDELRGKTTIIIVAHRLTTVLRCDKVYEVQNTCVSECSKEEIRERM